MKISKVDHTRMGMGNDFKGDRGGFLYYDPSRNSVENTYVADLEQHISRTLNKNAMVLYNAFSGVDDVISTSTNKKDNDGKVIIIPCNEAKKEFKKIINAFAKDLKNGLKQKGGINGQIAYFRRIYKLANINKKYLDNERMEQYTEKLFLFCVRKSLRVKLPNTKTDAKEVLKNLFVGYALNDKSKIDAISNADLEDFVMLLNKDYYKKEQSHQIAESIYKQDVRVAFKNGKIQLRNADTPAKKYIFDFVKDYASLETNEREKMLSHIGELISLYYTGDKTAGFKNIKQEFTENTAALLIDKENKIAEKTSLIAEKKIIDIIKPEPRTWEEKKKRSKLIAEIDELGSQIKMLNNAIKDDIRVSIIKAYRNTLSPDMSDSDKFWLKWIEERAESILVFKHLNRNKLDVGYLCERTYREFLSYITGKYMDIGKAVYHFTETDPANTDIIGSIKSEYADGVNGFDYEFIKAEESLSRDIAVYTQFARKNYLNVAKDKKSILAFFGGASCWQDVDLDDEELKETVKSAIGNIRNYSFHYAGSVGKLKNPEIVTAMMKHERDKVGLQICKKYYSNNVYWFYREDDVNQLMAEIYKNPAPTAMQVPAFNRIFSKKSLFENEYNILKLKPLQAIQKNSNAETDVFKAAYFFIMKEIYYYGFLAQGEEKLKTDFLAMIKKLKDAPYEKNKKKEKNSNGTKPQENRVSKNPFAALDGLFENKEPNRQPDGNNMETERIVLSKKDEKELKALDNFEKRIKQLENMPFGDMCGQIMSDYNIQNTSKEARNNKNSADEKYKHFRALLYKIIREMFVGYIKGNKLYEFIRTPEYNSEKEGAQPPETVDSSCGDFSGICGIGFFEKDESDPYFLPSLYITAHFMRPVHLNHLIGALSSYMFFVENIAAREKSTGNKIKNSDYENRFNKIKNSVDMLKFVQLFADKYTNEVDDYFDSKEEYAAYLSHFLDFEEKNGETYADKLKSFCNRFVKDGNGVYVDGENIILNRNFVKSKLYGYIGILSRCVEKVTEQELNNYLTPKKELITVFNRGTCETKDEQKLLKDYQNLKNRVEMYDIVTYSTIINDMITDFISWAYLRERDLMYYQLGFWYTRLNYSNTVPKDDIRRCVNGEGLDIKDGAVLYNIMAMYTPSRPMFKKDKNNAVKLSGENISIGGGFKKFSGFYDDEYKTYKEGLELFEDVEKDHDPVVEFRNMIDHNYEPDNREEKKDSVFVKNARCYIAENPDVSFAEARIWSNYSLLEIYSAFYGKFFNYDTKLKKSVSFILKNTLQRYFINSVLSFKECDPDTSNKRLASKTEISVEKMYSEKFEYKLADNNKTKVKLEAKSEEFIDRLKKLLEFKLCKQ